MKRSNLIALLATALGSVILFTCSLFAWYTKVKSSSDMSFDILQIDSLVTMYQANDDNFNGIPNLLTTGNEDKYYNPQIVDGSAVGYVAYSNMYHHEKYAFNYLDQKYALSQDSSANLLNTVTLNNVVPSKVYGFKYEITNYVGKENRLDLTFDPNAEINTTNLSIFETRVGVVAADGSLTFTEWKSFVTNNTYSGISFYENGITVPATSTPISTSKSSMNGRLDIWLQIRIKPEATTSVTNFELPEFRIRLSVEITEQP